MKVSPRKLLRLGLPLLVAVLYAAQTLIDYLETGQVSAVTLGLVVTFLTLFGILWYIERDNA